MKIGASGTCGFLWQGLIDEVDIFNRALTEAEIAAIFRAGSAGKFKPVASPAGLLSWWPLDGDAADIVDGNPGTPVNGAAFVPGFRGKAVALDGIDDHVIVPDSVNLNFRPTDPMTVDAWLFRTGTAGIMHILGKRASFCAGMHYQMAFDANGLRFDGDSGGVCGKNGVCTGISPPLNTWTHVAGTFDGSLFRFYIDGALVATSNPGSTLGPATTQPLKIGASETCGFLWKGLIDEVDVFNRALTGAEIAAIFRAGSAGKFKPVASLLSVAPATGTYGGTLNLSATLTAGSSGLSGKTVSFTLNGASKGNGTTNAAGLATLNNVSVAGINAGTYPTGVGGSFAGDSSFSASSGTAALTVSPAPLTGRADDKSRPYGTPNPQFTVTYSGFVNGETASLVTGTLSCTTTATATSPVGTYPITCSGQSAPNYAITYVAGTLTITPNSPAGTNVTSQPIDTATGAAAPVALTFSNITQGGTTTLTTTGAGQPPPAGFRLGNPPVYYDLNTTAVFSGPVTVCINYTGISFPNEDKLKLFHYENARWVNVTTSLDTINNIICGTVTSFSPFVIFEQFNQPPAVAAASPVSVNEGSTASHEGTYSDPDIPNGDVVTLSASTGSVSKLDSSRWRWTAAAASPDGPSQSQVTVTATDSQGATATATFTVNVVNVAPVPSFNLSANPIAENGSVTLNGSFTDPGTVDTHTAAIDWGDGSLPTALQIAAGVRSFSANHQYLDDNPTGTASDSYPITVTMRDKDLASGTASGSITVNNVAPAISGVSGPTSPLALGTAAALSASFSDAGAQDTHTCTFTWDDGTTSTAPGSAGSCSASRTYAAAGVYTVSIEVRDDDGGADTRRYEFVVVYDPAAGFVTGGGWINSPAGAYVANQTLTGRANFGFVSRYQRGATTPTGKTEFQFRVANFNFHSTIYEWLVVAGARAQYKGSGTVNGTGDYGFLLTATDGQLPGGSGVDKFRIKIWDKASGAVVYDNVLGASEDLDAANPQEIAGGSIVIHP